MTAAAQQQMTANQSREGSPTTCRDAVFPVRLFVLYVLCVAVPLALFDGPLDPSSPHPEDYAEMLANCLALIPALVVVVMALLWNFRKFPIFAGCTLVFAVALEWKIWGAYRPGFSEGYVITFAPLEITAALLAVPFIAAYLIWRFWPRRKIRA